MYPVLFEKTENAVPQSLSEEQTMVQHTAVCALEQGFPHVIEKVQTMWGHPELGGYLRQLTLDNRGDRRGFPVEAWSELYFLMEFHQYMAIHNFR